VSSATNRILVVDDDLGLRDGCRRVLGGQGYEVETAAGGREALERIRSARFDLALLDIMMPDMSGLDVLVDARRIDPDLVCVILTGYATVELAVEAVRRGAYDFCSKPFSADELIRAVSRGLEHRALTLEARRLQDVEREAQDLERARAELERVDRARSQLMFTVAHELRAPVAAIQGFLRVILEGYVSPEKSREMLQRAEVRAGELIHLIQDLLQLASLREAPPPSTRPRADVAGALREVLSLLALEAEAKHIELKVATVSEAWAALPAEHMREVWTNLIGNAIRYTQGAGSIRVDVSVRDGLVVGSVADTGIGIDAADLPKLFQEFYRTQEARAMVKGGTGLGLAIVKRILDAAGGKIQVRSVLGKGSTFVFEVPEATHDPAQPETAG
jgi:signal transduction histidine kinase